VPPAHGVITPPISSAGCWMARANENASAQGNCDWKRTFMAFKRAEASSQDWPPIRTQPRNGGGHGAQQAPHRGIGNLVHVLHFVLLAVGQPHSILLFADGNFFHFFPLGQVNPGRTILGFRMIPSSITPGCEAG